MSNENLNKKIVNATKWSGITEIAAKLIAPITTMVLARLLTPDAFGVLVTAQMVISFAEIFTDAGFQKYLVQHEFIDDDDKNKSTAVAFWSNFIFSMIVWLGICLFADSIAKMVGCEGEGIVIAISSVCIPLAAFSSIQMALFKRDFDFKTLFWVRIVGILIPLIVTVPLAFILRSYWALIIGMIALNLSNSILLTVKSKWKPKWYYSIERFKAMFSFTMWSMIESVSIWLTMYFDIFIVGTMLSQYYLGLYRTSMTTVAQITSIITAATTPVLFSSLSRLQNSEKDFNETFFKFQKLVSILVLPLGVGIYLFSDFITEVLLGEQWIEASRFIGLWGITSALLIVLSHYSSEVFRSKGKPKLSVLSQCLHIAALWPTVLITVHYDFETLCIARSFIRLQSVLVSLLLLGCIIKMNIIKMLMNILPSLMASLCMMFILLLPKASSVAMNILYVIICGVIYFSVIILFPKERNVIFKLKTLILCK